MPLTFDFASITGPAPAVKAWEVTRSLAPNTDDTLAITLVGRHGAELIGTTVRAEDGGFDATYRLDGAADYSFRDNSTRFTGHLDIDEAEIIVTAIAAVRDLVTLLAVRDYNDDWIMAGPWWIRAAFIYPFAESVTVIPTERATVAAALAERVLDYVSGEDTLAGLRRKLHDQLLGITVDSGTVTLSSLLDPDAAVTVTNIGAASGLSSRVDNMSGFEFERYERLIHGRSVQYVNAGSPTGLFAPVGQVMVERTIPGIYGDIQAAMDRYSVLAALDGLEAAELTLELGVERLDIRPNATVELDADTYGYASWRVVTATVSNDGGTVSTRLTLMPTYNPAGLWRWIRRVITPRPTSVRLIEKSGSIAILQISSQGRAVFDHYHINVGIIHNNGDREWANALSASPETDQILMYPLTPGGRYVIQAVAHALVVTSDPTALAFSADTETPASPGGVTISPGREWYAGRVLEEPGEIEAAAIRSRSATGDSPTFQLSDNAVDVILSDATAAGFEPYQPQATAPAAGGLVAIVAAPLIARAGRASISFGTYYSVAVAGRTANFVSGVVRAQFLAVTNRFPAAYRAAGQARDVFARKVAAVFPGSGPPPGGSSLATRLGTAATRLTGSPVALAAGRGVSSTLSTLTLAGRGVARTLPVLNVLLLPHTILDAINLLGIVGSWIAGPIPARFRDGVVVTVNNDGNGYPLAGMAAFIRWRASGRPASWTTFTRVNSLIRSASYPTSAGVTPTLDGLSGVDADGNATAPSVVFSLGEMARDNQLEYQLAFRSQVRTPRGTLFSGQGRVDSPVGPAVDTPLASCPLPPVPADSDALVADGGSRDGYLFTPSFRIGDFDA